MNLHHLWAVARKEFYHIVRDPGTLLLMTVGPIFLTLILVYTLTADVKDVAIGVVDLASNGASQELSQRLAATGVVKITQHLSKPEDAEPFLERGDIRAVVVIPESYGNMLDFLTGKLSQLKITVDGTEPTSAEHVLNTIYTVSEAHLTQMASEALAKIPGLDLSLLQEPVTIQVDTRYNPGLRTIVDFYPGLTAIVLSLPGIALALALARENELGTMERLIATPISKLSLLMGKILPYLAFGMIDVLILVGIGRVLYDVPFRGSLISYLMLSLLFLFANMGLGLLISVLLRSQQVAMITAFLIFFFPSFFLSGVFFPLKVMPAAVQLELNFLPVTHYVTAGKALYLQGSPITALWASYAMLAALGAGILCVVVALFRKKVA